MTEADRDYYCRGDYRWCRRYMSFQALQKELERLDSRILDEREGGAAKGTRGKV